LRGVSFSINREKSRTCRGATARADDGFRIIATRNRLIRADSQTANNLKIGLLQRVISPGKTVHGGLSASERLHDYRSQNAV